MKKRVLSIPPRLDYIICLIIGAIITLSMILYDVESQTPIRTNEDRLIFIGLAIVFFCRWYVIYEECLVLEFLFVPVRKIPWSYVCGAFYFLKPQRKKTDVQPTIILMLSPLSIDDLPKPDQIPQFIKTNKRHLIQIQLPPFSHRVYIETIEQYAGHIHYYTPKENR